jgi:hypothetical protein
VADETLETLKRLETKVTALLVILVDQYVRETGLAQPRPRSVDRMLVDSGLTGSEVARLLGKSPQAVSQVLAKEGRPKSNRATNLTNSKAGNRNEQEATDGREGT